jgi:hypothetical protein
MKLLKSILILALAIMAVACSNNEAPNQQQLGPAPAPINPNAVTSTPPATGGVPGQLHYICPNGCAGSGGDTQGTCPTCGTAYAHNAAYHGQPAQTPQQPQQSSAVNAAGVYHYTCPNGCAGGAGTAGACATCGSTLAHNQAYHDAPAGGVVPQGGATNGQKSPLFVN